MSDFRFDGYNSRAATAAQVGVQVRGRPYTERTFINWELDGKGPPVTRVGRDVCYFWPSVKEWLRSQEKSAA
ncbi:hypothetical protein [Bradyrhizobium cajani]|uniref:DNA-binding protein n=1 Tax=Bradyrhizobium cajani TaxID=1928661 RepID=A0A844TJ22_9BRAD|nr:hypothetical protein [Bradyrhizobium cajani]MCP3370769.1 hypothetical protein [Bradyrhizobium cajani]MVT75874.1 hypothetical protein [Bradyrhizobium cajani]